MNSYNLKQTIMFAKLRNLGYDFVYFFEKFPDDFAQNPPQCTRLSIRAMEKKIKHDIGRPPPPFSTVPSVLAYLLPQPEVANACSIWCVPSTVITASHLPLLPTQIYY